MKKSLVFVGIFCLFLVILQILSGMLLTFMYTPNLSWDQTPVNSQVEFGSVDLLSPLVIPLIALAITFATTRLISRKKG
ncbi:hypothetical protein J14TS2_50530 [Bacillus sp. J14TS2]|uniref:hypothetical protein n=1 Tax=Bacillus sp. J14TS2 TaxID=2807188 RepID=UPI001B1C07BE|nr:hypothetical protein [Bacillus sp. J14TS2]GIN74578.1 hypothetical protein J14TS2_50530 [Bacillus sp. J14TS2]